MRRTRSAAVTLAAAHAVSPPATAQEMPVAILDPTSGTVTPYGLPAAETARQRPARPSRCEAFDDALVTGWEEFEKPPAVIRPPGGFPPRLFTILG